MNITYIEIISIPVQDQVAAKDFYVEKLDFKVIRDDTFGSQRWIQLAPSTVAQTSITLVSGILSLQPGSQKGIVLGTKDIQTDSKILKERGIGISEVEKTPWAMEARFSDLDGNGWVLQQRTWQG